MPPSPRQLKALQAGRGQGIGRLLLRARRDFVARVADKLGVESEVVTQARARLMPYVDVDGTRSVELARRVGVTRQAVAKLVAELEAQGLLCREPDGSDGRAFLVKFTPEGLDYMVRQQKAIQQIEREYEQLLGTARLAELKLALEAIADSGGDPAGTS